MQILSTFSKFSKSFFSKDTQQKCVLATIKKNLTIFFLNLYRKIDDLKVFVVLDISSDEKISGSELDGVFQRVIRETRKIGEFTVDDENYSFHTLDGKLDGKTKWDL